MGNSTANNLNNKPQKSSPFGVLTPAKTSGLAYSAAAIIPVVLAGVFTIVLSLFGLVNEGYDKTEWYTYCSFLLPQLAFALTAALILVWTKSSFQATVRSQACRWKYFLLAVLLQFGLFSLSELNGLFLEFLGRFGYKNEGIVLPSLDGFGVYGVLLTVAVLPAVFEEIIFRGIVLKGLRVFGAVGAVLICGALFSLYHQNPAQTIYQFCCGAAFALLALRAGSILPTVLAHFLNNAAIILLTKWNVDGFSAPVNAVVIVLSALCLLVTLFWLIFKEKQPAQKGEKSERKSFWLFAAVGVFACAASWALALAEGL